jgi:hypothetical protein
MTSATIILTLSLYASFITYFSIACYVHINFPPTVSMFRIIAIFQIFNLKIISHKTYAHYQSPHQPSQAHFKCHINLALIN